MYLFNLGLNENEPSIKNVVKADTVNGFTASHGSLIVFDNGTMLSFDS
jgi:hypothetical protein